MHTSSLLKSTARTVGAMPMVVLVMLLSASCTPSERVDAEPTKEFREPAEHGGVNEKTSAAAIAWWREQADSGEAWAQLLLGDAYSSGTGVTRNDLEAVKWYRKAAAQGEMHAQERLGYFYLTGEGVARNYTDALKWLRMSAEQGNAAAQQNLAVMFAEGLGTDRNYQEAVKWTGKAAEQGNADAQFTMGMLYANGALVEEHYLVEKNYALALMWLYLAQLRDQATADDAVATLSKQMTSEQIDEAQRMAMEWQMKNSGSGGD